jgi:hypothetical protein
MSKDNTPPRRSQAAIAGNLHDDDEALPIFKQLPLGAVGFLK